MGNKECTGRTCPTCGGSGQEIFEDMSEDGDDASYEDTCSECHGSGVVVGPA